MAGELVGKEHGDRMDEKDHLESSKKDNTDPVAIDNIDTMELKENMDVALMEDGKSDKPMNHGNM